ncbi:hypothetical protein JB92DRAFT_2935187 [Gautieria morchelliformis]|nr:hypothetical protein JB92DRAFT_2935187 [Gautieria morchelliformis]
MHPGIPFTPHRPAHPSPAADPAWGNAGVHVAYGTPAPHCTCPFSFHLLLPISPTLEAATTPPIVSPSFFLLSAFLVHRASSIFSP